MTYTLGTKVEMRVDVEDETGAATDPAALTLEYRTPAGVTVTKHIGDLQHVGVGAYTYTVDATEAGTWLYEFIATDPTVVNAGEFDVDGSVLTAGILQPGAGPCSPWATETDLLDGWTPPSSGSTAVYQRCLDASSDILYARSGRRFPGICTDRVRPLGAFGGMPLVLPFGGSMAEVGGAGSFDSPSFAPHHTHPIDPEDPFEITLGSYPIRGVQEVRVDGVVLDPSKWRVMDWARLRRIDGITWPCCNFIIGDVARVEVDLTFGMAPPPSGWLACVALARELTKALAREECALDRRVQQITREGVTMTIPGLVDSLKDGKTGIPEVDLFLWSHNPTGLARRARVIIPGRDRPPTRRTFP